MDRREFIRSQIKPYEPFGAVLQPNTSAATAERTAAFLAGLRARAAQLERHFELMPTAKATHRRKPIKDAPGWYESQPVNGIIKHEPFLPRRAAMSGYWSSLSHVNPPRKPLRQN